MSQTKKIYEYLVKTPNTAADKALTLGLKMINEPYKSAIFEIILDRSAADSTIGLIQNFHNFSQEFQDTMENRVDDLYTGLCQAVNHPDSQTRFNVLEIVYNKTDLRMIDLVTALMSDRQYQISQFAGRVLLKMKGRGDTVYHLLVIVRRNKTAQIDLLKDIEEARQSPNSYNAAKFEKRGDVYLDKNPFLAKAAFGFALECGTANDEVVRKKYDRAVREMRERWKDVKNRLPRLLRNADKRAILVELDELIKLVPDCKDARNQWARQLRTYYRR